MSAVSLTTADIVAYAGRCIAQHQRQIERYHARALAEGAQPMSRWPEMISITRDLAYEANVLAALCDQVGDAAAASAITTSVSATANESIRLESEARRAQWAGPSQEQP